MSDLPLNVVQEELRCRLLWDRQSDKQLAFSKSDKRIRVVFGGNRCLPLDSPILLANGKWKDLEQIKAGDKVRCGCSKDVVVLSTSYAGEKQVYELIFEENPNKSSTHLIASLEHEFPVLFGMEVTAKKRKLSEIMRQFSLGVKVRFLGFKKNDKGVLVEKDRYLKKYRPSGVVECGDFEVNCKCHSYISYDYIVTGNTGKTHLAMQELCMYAFGNHKSKKIKTPVSIWCCCPSYDLQRDTTQKKLEEMIPKHRIKKINYVKSDVWGTVFLDNGSDITFKSYDSGREKFQGAAKRLVTFDEEPPYDIWEEATMRVQAGVPLDIILSMTPVKGKCFSSDTELLTNRGWVTYNKLLLTDKFLCYDETTKTMKWGRMTGLYFNPDYHGDMVNIKLRAFDFLVTPEHKWVTQNGKIKTNELNSNHMIIRMADSIANNDIQNTQEEILFAELVGWAVTEGHFCVNKCKISIGQSYSANKNKCERIKFLLESLSKEWSYRQRPYSAGRDGVYWAFSINGDFARKIRSVATKSGVSGAWLCSLSREALLALYEGFILGDGQKKKNGDYFTQSTDRMGLVASFQLICSLLGRQSSVSYYNYGENRKLAARVFVNTSKKVVRSAYKNMTVENIKYDGVIWCPMTEYGTVVARRNGTVSISSNTWVYDKIFLDTDNPDLYITNLTWDDNPWLTTEQKQQMARNLTEEARRVRERGEFIEHTGLVCNWWDRGTHIVHDLQRQADWNIYRVIDFGWSSSKTCVLWIGVNSLDQVFVFDGIYVNEVDDEQLSNMIKAKERDFRVTAAFADNTPDRLKTLSNNGVKCEPIKKVSDEDWDVAKAEALFKLGKIDPTTGKSRLFISSALTIFDTKLNRSVNWFAVEAESLRWKDKRTSTGVKTETAHWDKDNSPEDSHFDALDALSYFAIMFTRKNARYKTPLAKDFDSDWGESRKKSAKKKLINPLTGY